MSGIVVVYVELAGGLDLRCVVNLHKALVVVERRTVDALGDTSWVEVRHPAPSAVACLLAFAVRSFRRSGEADRKATVVIDRTSSTNGQAEDKTFDEMVAGLRGEETTA